MAKLILDIEPELINKIEKFAEAKQLSISDYVKDLVKKSGLNSTTPFKLKDEHELSDWVKSLVLAKEPTPDFDHKKEYRKHLEEKYGI